MTADEKQLLALLAATDEVRQRLLDFFTRDRQGAEK